MSNLKIEATEIKLSAEQFLNLPLFINKSIFDYKNIFGSIKRVEIQQKIAKTKNEDDDEEYENEEDNNASNPQK